MCCLSFGTNGQTFQSSGIRMENRRHHLTALTLLWLFWDVRNTAARKREGDVGPKYVRLCVCIVIAGPHQPSICLRCKPTFNLLYQIKWWWWLQQFIEIFSLILNKITFFNERFISWGMCLIGPSIVKHTIQANYIGLFLWQDFKLSNFDFIKNTRQQ